MGVVNSVQERLAPAGGAGSASSPTATEHPGAQVARQLAINWNAFDHELETVLVELISRVLCTSTDDVDTTCGGGASTAISHSESGCSVGAPQQLATALPSSASSRPLFSSSLPMHSARGTPVTACGSSSGPRPSGNATTAAADSAVTSADLAALAVAFLSLDADGCSALVESMAYIASGQTRRERLELQCGTSSSSVALQGVTSSTVTGSEAPARVPLSATSGRSGSSQRTAPHCTPGTAGQGTPISRGTSAPITPGGGAVSSSSPSTLSSLLLHHSTDSPSRITAAVSLSQLQRQQDQLRLDPTAFGDQAHNNTLLMSMSRRSSNSDFHGHAHQDSRQYSGVTLASSRNSGSALTVPSRHPHRGSSLDNLYTTAGTLGSPHTSRMLTPRAPSTFLGSATLAPQPLAGSAAATSRPTSRRPSFASGIRPALSTLAGSTTSMNSVALAELPQSHHTAAASTYVTSDHIAHLDDKFAGHTPLAVLKSLNALLAHLHMPAHAVAALWVLFFEVVCDVQERAQSRSAQAGASPAQPSTRLGTSSHFALQPVANTTSHSSADDVVQLSPSLQLVGSSSSTTATAAAHVRPAGASPHATACRLAVTPVIERWVLPHYLDACAVLRFASGCTAPSIFPVPELTHGSESDNWRPATGINSEPHVSTTGAAAEENVLRHSLTGGLPSLMPAPGVRVTRPFQAPSSHAGHAATYVSPTSRPTQGHSSVAPRGRDRSGSVSTGHVGALKGRGGEAALTSLAQQYFREECTMLLGCGSGHPSVKAQPTGVAASTSATSTSVPTDTLIADPLVQKTAFVLHYAEHIALPPQDERAERPASPSAPSAVSLWQMRTRLLSMRQHYLYVYDAMASTVALLRGDLSATVAPPSANVELNAPIALVDLAGAAGSDLRVVSGASDAEVMPVRGSRTSRGRPAASDPFFTPDTYHNAELLKGTRSEDTTVCRVQNEDGELFLLVLPSATRRAGESVEQSAVTLAAAELEQRLSRPGVLSLMPTDSASDGAAHPQSFTRVQGDEHVALSVHPLRILYHGVLHHFFFQNANVRAQWYDHIMATATVLRSRRQLARVAAAPQDLSQFLHRRVSYPVGPAAFDYLDMLGVGGFGRVLLVRHKLSGKLFAMKIIRKFKFHGMRNVVEVRRECSTLRSVDCPYVMRIHTIFQTDSRVYILLDYLSGGEVLVHTQKTDTHHFDNDTARFFIAELAIALESLRVQGIVHRDIKGDNVVLDADGHAVLTDFGFAKRIVEPDPVAAQEARAREASGNIGPRHAEDTCHIQGRIRWQHSSCGTLAYLAPEVLQRTPPRNGYGLEADWWSLGVVLFTMLTGYFPFLKEDNESTKRAIVSSPLQFPPKVPLSDTARELMRGLMEKDPLKRIATLAQMKAHPYFSGFDWAACEARRLRPPVLLHKDMYQSPSSGSSAARRLRATVGAILERERASAQAEEGAGVEALTPQTERDSDEVTLSVEPVSNKKYARELEEEIEELRLVEKAFGPDAMPVPTTLEGDVFGPLYSYQEACGSDREDVLADPSLDYAPSRHSTAQAGGEASTGRGLLPRVTSTSWFDPCDNSYIPAVEFALPLSPAGLRGGVGSGALHRAQERENALLSDNASFMSQDALAASTFDGDFLPILNDFNEAAYMSMQEVQPTDARLASDTTGFFRPLMPSSS